MSAVAVESSAGIGFGKARHVVLSVCLFALASCATRSIEDWPVSVPPQQVFIDAYTQDSENQNRQSQTEYLQWMLSFYQGSLTYQSGWQDISGGIFEAPNEAQQEELLTEVRELGIVIGSEWAKHNDVRLIDTRMLSIWGSTIQLAPDFEKQRETVEVIVEDVELLLSGDLGKEEIDERRYSAKLGIDLFEGF